MHASERVCLKDCAAVSSLHACSTPMYINSLGSHSHGGVCAEEGLVAGQMPLDVAALGCDWLTGTSRKYLRGPRGLGLLYASRYSLYSQEHDICHVWTGP